VVGVEISLQTADDVRAPDFGVLQSISKTPSPIATSGLAAGRVVIRGRFYTQRGLVSPWSEPLAFNSQAI
jgi:hypothetical protein